MTNIRIFSDINSNNFRHKKIFSKRLAFDASCDDFCTPNDIPRRDRRVQHELGPQACDKGRLHYFFARI